MFEYLEDKRVCPVCGHVDGDGEGGHILTAFNGQTSNGGMMGCCHCPRCDSVWDELDYLTATFITIVHSGDQHHD